MGKASQEDLWRLRGLIQRVGWGEFMRDVGSLMGEQCDKTDGEQSSNLFNCSNTIHALDRVFEKCGTFDYRPSRGMIPEEYRKFIET